MRPTEGESAASPPTIRQLMELLGFDPSYFVDDRIRWALIELLLRRRDASGDA